jgi:hypothetical protein
MAHLPLKSTGHPRTAAILQDIAGGIVVIGLFFGAAYLLLR